MNEGIGFSSSQIAADAAQALGNQAKTSKPAWLRNRYGFVLRYIPNGSTVTVERRYRGAELKPLVMLVAEAREHYRSQRRAGYTTPEGDL